MAKSYEEMMQSVSPAIRKAAIAKARVYKATMAKELQTKLRMIRKSSGLGQVQLATLMGVKQPAIARLEKQGDIKLSTLRNLCMASGGTMEVHVKLKNQKVIIG